MHECVSHYLYASICWACCTMQCNFMQCDATQQIKNSCVYVLVTNAQGGGPQLDWAALQILSRKTCTTNHLVDCIYQSQTVGCIVCTNRCVCMCNMQIELLIQKYPEWPGTFASNCSPFMPTSDNKKMCPTLFERHKQQPTSCQITDTFGKWRTYEPWFSPKE